MEEYLSSAIHSALDYYDYETAEWLSQQLITITSTQDRNSQVAAYIQLGRIFVSRHEYTICLTLLEQAPSVEEVQFLRAQCLLHEKRHDELEPVFTAVISSILKVLDASYTTTEPLVPSSSDPYVYLDTKSVQQSYPILLAHCYRLQATFFRRTARIPQACQSYAKALEYDDTLWSCAQALCELKAPFNPSKQTFQLMHPKSPDPCPPHLALYLKNTHLEHEARQTLQRVPVSALSMVSLSSKKTPGGKRLLSGNQPQSSTQQQQVLSSFPSSSLHAKVHPPFASNEEDALSLVTPDPNSQLMSPHSIDGGASHHDHETTYIAPRDGSGPGSGGGAKRPPPVNRGKKQTFKTRLFSRQPHPVSMSDSEDDEQQHSFGNVAQSRKTKGTTTTTAPSSAARAGARTAGHPHRNFHADLSGIGIIGGERDNDSDDDHHHSGGSRGSIGRLPLVTNLPSYSDESNDEMSMLRRYNSSMRNSSNLDDSTDSFVLSRGSFRSIQTLRDDDDDDEGDDDDDDDEYDDSDYNTTNHDDYSESIHANRKHKAPPPMATKKTAPFHNLHDDMLSPVYFSKSLTSPPPAPQNRTKTRLPQQQQQKKLTKMSFDEDSSDQEYTVRHSSTAVPSHKVGNNNHGRMPTEAGKRGRQPVIMRGDQSDDDDDNTEPSTSYGTPLEEHPNGQPNVQSVMIGRIARAHISPLYPKLCSSSSLQQYSTCDARNTTTTIAKPTPKLAQIHSLSELLPIFHQLSSRSGGTGGILPAHNTKTSTHGVSLTAPDSIDSIDKCIPLVEASSPQHELVSSLYTGVAALQTLVGAYNCLHQYDLRGMQAHYSALPGPFKRGLSMLLILAQLQVNQAANHDAVLLYQRIVDMYPYNITGMEYYSSTLHILNDHTSLNILTQRLYSIAPRSYETLMTLGNCFSLYERKAVAARCFTIAAKTRLDESYPYILLGFDALDMSNVESALSYFQHALRINPHNFRGWLGLGSLQAVYKRYDHAIQAYEKAIKINPINTTIDQNLAEIQLFRKQSAPALLTINRAIEKAKTRARSQLVASRILVHTSLGAPSSQQQPSPLPSSSIASLTASAQPTKRQLPNRVLSLTSKQSTGASIATKVLSKLNPSSTRDSSTSSRHQKRSSPINMGGSSVTMAISPSDAHLFLQKACILAEIGQFQEALVAINIFLTYFPSEVNGYFILSKIHYKLQNHDDSLDAMYHALDIADNLENQQQSTVIHAELQKVHNLIQNHPFATLLQYNPLID